MLKHFKNAAKGKGKSKGSTNVYDRSHINAQKMEKLDEFCEILRQLAELLYSKGQGNKYIADVKTLVDKGTKADPPYVIKKIGPYLLTYQQQITEGKPEFFRDLDYDTLYGNKKNYNSKAVIAIKEIASTFTDSEIQEIVKKVQTGLLKYCEFLELEAKTH
jgi:hypothetical protein